MRTSRDVPLPGQSPTVLPILCPHCATPLARLPRMSHSGDVVAMEDLAACLSCGRFGDYETLVDDGVLDGGVLSAREIEQYSAELGGLRDQAARAEATDRGD